MATNVESLAQFDKIQTQLSPKTELIVLFFFDPRYEKCSRMEGIVDVWSEDDEYINRVLFIKCNKETSNHDIFEKYNIKAMPTTLFIKNNEQIAPPATGSVDIEEVINGILNSKK